jgi:hypothetical protein
LAALKNLFKLAINQSFPFQPNWQEQEKIKKKKKKFKIVVVGSLLP